MCLDFSCSWSFLCYSSCVFFSKNKFIIFAFLVRVSLVALFHCRTDYTLHYSSCHFDSLILSRSYHCHPVIVIQCLRSSRKRKERGRRKQKEKRKRKRDERKHAFHTWKEKIERKHAFPYITMRYPRPK